MGATTSAPVGEPPALGGTIASGTVDERRERGRALRRAAPRSAHAEWSPPPDRFDPVAVVEDQDEGRLPWLVPVRHARMGESAFAFYRGAAAIMARDLSGTPVTGLRAQICGDAHLSNFGVFGSPERRLVFDVNDFDETLAGPWEWDLKRLAVSFTIVGQHRGFDGETCRRTTRRVVQVYRESMADFASQRALEVWYAYLPLEELFGQVQSTMTKQERRSAEKSIRKARSKDNLGALSKLAEKVDGRYRIKSQPPLLVPLRDLPADQLPTAIDDVLQRAFEDYADTLRDDRRVLLSRYRLADFALKVVGVGSVGTRCFVALFEGRDEQDPLFLQIKEAGTSVLEPFLGPSPYANAGRRVVEGQRLMQAVGDIFLGWAAVPQSGRNFYMRQLHDMKGSVDLEAATPDQLWRYARLCGWTLARAHARTGDPIAIAAYLGSGEVLDEALSAFAEAYAEQNRRDYEAFAAAIDSGRLSAGS